MSQVKPTLAGSFPIFKAAGIQVYLHWSWLLIAVLELQFRANSYSSQLWNVAEYLSLFAIVLLHEFGHATACRQVGGRADEIVLWPLGGIAFVSPPPRPGPVLWSIAAGPLVNVLLVPVTEGALSLADNQGLPQINPDANHFLLTLTRLNEGLLIFNMLPIYPLDGGQILQALLWFIMGQARSLMVVSVIGMAVALGVIVLAVREGSIWFGILAVFVASRCWAGFQQARILARLAQGPVHEDAVCPSCRAHPPMGSFWACGHCHARFDTFVHRATCPRCGTEFPTTSCLHCGHASPMGDWLTSAGKPTAGEGEAPEPT
jgi:Zn-dependent protease